MRKYTRDDVQQHTVGYGYNALPAVNVKVHDAFYWWGDDMESIVRDVRDELGADETFNLEYVRDVLEHDDEGTWFYSACEDGWEMLAEAAEYVFDAYNVKVWAEGRQSGWCVVDGLPDLEEWDAVLLGKWRKFEKQARVIADDVPRAMAWLICANKWEQEQMQRREDDDARTCEGVPA